MRLCTVQKWEDYLWQELRIVLGHTKTYDWVEIARRPDSHPDVQERDYVLCRVEEMASGKNFELSRII